VLNLLWLIFLILVLGSIFYYLYSIYSAQKFFLFKDNIKWDFYPPISILKPLYGLEVNIVENLTSFIQQNYPSYQIIFCVREKDDPVINIVNNLIDNFPNYDLKLVVNNRLIGYNYKVSNLANGLEFCDYDLILIADSDIQVKPDYLATIIKPFQDEKVGIVTCLYQSLGNSLVSIIESIGICCDFIPSVLTARQLEGVKFAFGSTILIRKKVLERLGNFETIANSLADDFLLGNLTTTLGYEVILSNYIVTHNIEEETFNNYFLRQIRWFRCIKIQRFKGYLGMIFTQGLINSIIFMVMSKFSLLSLLLLLITFSLRLILGYLVGVKYLKNETCTQYLGLVFFVDIIRFFIWLIGLFGNKIQWKDNHFILDKNGQISESLKSKSNK